MSDRCWDSEDCPNCGGDLQQQDRFNVMCLDCESVYTHVTDESEHTLRDEDGSVQSAKPRVATDGGATCGDGTEQLAQYSATIWGGQAHAQRVIHTPQAVLQTRLDGRLNRSDNPLPDGVLQSVRPGSHRSPHHKLDIFPYGFSSREHQEAWQGALSLQKQGDCTDRSLQPGTEHSEGDADE